MLLVGFLRGADRADGVLGSQHVPTAVRSEDQAAVTGDVDRVDSDVGLRAHHEHILLAVVGPEISQ